MQYYDYKKSAGPAAIVAIGVLVAVGLWKTGGDLGRGRLVLNRRPKAVMGTTCSLAVITETRGQAAAEEALDRAEAAIRRIESLMSSWIEDSEISVLSRAPVGQAQKLSRETLEVLHAAQKAHADTQGAFDVACLPLVELWRDAAAKNQLPTEEEIARAKADSSWNLLRIEHDGAVRLGEGVRIDMGGIAKGHAVDRAVEILKSAGVQGGMVDIGGDLACFGQPPKEGFWTVDVQNPFESTVLAKLRLFEGAVCTSGDYARFTVIAGRKISHIIDTRSGRPTDSLPSVTVLAPRARDADVWATALSVLGPEGFELLPADVEAMIVVGTKDDYGILITEGMYKLLEKPLPQRITVWH